MGARWGDGRFGRSVALSSDGGTALISGPEDNVKLGAVWVFTNPDPYAPTAPAEPVSPATQTSSATQTSAAGGASNPAGGTIAAPIITDLSQSHLGWREGNEFASLARRQKLPPVGTIFSFTLNEQASVSFSFMKHVHGRKINGTCEIESRGRQGILCTRTITKGTFTLTGHGGKNEVSFDGRVSDSDELGPGSYTVTITATASGKHSTTGTLHFTIAS